MSIDSGGRSPSRSLQPAGVRRRHERRELAPQIGEQPLERVVETHLVRRGEVEVPLHELEVAVDPAAPIEVAQRLVLHRPEPVDERARDRLLPDARPLEHAGHERVDLARRHRLHEVAGDVAAEGLGERGVLLALGDHDDLKVRVDLPQLGQRLEAAHPRHLLVEKDQVERTPSHELGGVVGVRRGLDLEPFVTQEHAVWLEQLRLVVDPEDGLGLVRHGSNVAVHEKASNRNSCGGWGVRGDGKRPRDAEASRGRELPTPHSPPRFAPSRGVPRIPDSSRASFASALRAPRAGVPIPEPGHARRTRAHRRRA